VKRVCRRTKTKELSDTPVIILSQEKTSTYIIIHYALTKSHAQIMVNQPLPMKKRQMGKDVANRQCKQLDVDDDLLLLPSAVFLGPCFHQFGQQRNYCLGKLYGDDVAARETRNQKWESPTLHWLICEFTLSQQAPGIILAKR